MIARLVWTTWTPMYAVPKRPLNWITNERTNDCLFNKYSKPTTNEISKPRTTELFRGEFTSDRYTPYTQRANNGPLTRFEKLWVAHTCAGNAGNVFSTTDLKKKTLVSDPGMHHVTCLTHVPWCMSVSLTCGGGGNVPGIPGACAVDNFAYLVRGPRRSVSMLCRHNGQTPS